MTTWHETPQAFISCVLFYIWDVPPMGFAFLLKSWVCVSFKLASAERRPAQEGDGIQLD